MTERTAAPLLRFEETDLSEAAERMFDLRAYFGGCCAAYARAFASGEALVLEHLFVTHALRLRGIGSAVVRRLKEIAARENLQCLRCRLWGIGDPLEVARLVNWLRCRGIAVSLSRDVVHESFEHRLTD